MLLNNIFNLEEGITEDLVRLSFFTETGKAIASCSSLKETLNQVMEHIGQIFSPCNWSLLLVNRKTGNLKFEIVVGEAASTLTGVEVEKGKGITGWIAGKGVPIIIEDVTKDHRFDDSFDRLSGFVTKSIIGVPLKSNGKVFGVIELVNKLDGSNFTALDLKVLTTIADFAAIAVEKAYYLSTLKRMVNIDPLTNVFNRRFLYFYMDKELKRNRRDRTYLSLLFIDIDDFKKINDNCGHVAGDKILLAVARILTGCVRESDMVFRFGGDEFIVLLPRTLVEDAKKLERRILEKVEEFNRTSDIKVSLTIGCRQANGEDLEDVICMVDKDMYLRKQLKQESSVTDLAEHIVEEVSMEDEKN